jgi:hypothetical protein
MFVGKGRSILQRGAPERYFTWVGYGLTRKLKTSFKRPARKKTQAYWAHSKYTKKKVL